MIIINQEVSSFYDKLNLIEQNDPIVNKNHSGLSCLSLCHGINYDQPIYFTTIPSLILTIIMIVVHTVITPPSALVELLPVPNPDKGGGLGMGLATPSRRKTNS